MTEKTLFEPYALGPLTLANRIVMAPLTRNRAGKGLVPSEFAAEYYSQRASAGLLISEATQISQQGQGYQDTPGIYYPAQRLEQRLGGLDRELAQRVVEVGAHQLQDEPLPVWLPRRTHRALSLHTGADPALSQQTVWPIARSH